MQLHPTRKMTQSSTLEIHGRQACPFAWRARLVAAEKQLAFRWIPFDVTDPDPRASANPERKSPLIIDGDFRLIESEVIAWYLDERYSGPSLTPTDPQARAQLRLQLVELESLKPSGPPSVPMTQEAVDRIRKVMLKLDAHLADGRAFLGGNAPSLVDLLLWPMLAALDARGVTLTEQTPNALAWWARAQARESYRTTSP
jgi:glutathione S-transferase